MSSSIKLILLLPEWLRLWVRQQLLPLLGIGVKQMAFGAMAGVFDTLLLFFMGFGFLVGGRVYMDGQFALPREVQVTAVTWAPISDSIARRADIPREVPLVLWWKENALSAVNPDSCTGIIGAYDLVRSGSHACFAPGPISDVEVFTQLTIAANEYKKRCPDITYFSQDPESIKSCYFAYNAGMGAAKRLDANNSAYVMNRYDEAHQNMVYSDVELGTVVLTQMGAWPAHLAMQGLITSKADGMGKRPLSITLLDINTRAYDWLAYEFDNLFGNTFTGDGEPITFPLQRDLTGQDCIGTAHLIGRPSLRPTLNPVSESPILTQDIHGCSYSLPGLDISSSNGSAVLQSSIPGQVTTYTDQWHNSTVRIENDEWIVWYLHPRSYLIKEGSVKRGEAVAVMGAIGNATGSHVHYTIYDKINDTFVDPRNFVP